MLFVAFFLVSAAAAVILPPVLPGHHGLAWAAGEMDEAFQSFWDKVVEFMNGTPGTVIAALMFFGGAVQAAFSTRKLQGIVLMAMAAVFKLLPAIATDFVGSP